MGYFSGREYLDQLFNRQSLSDGILFGEPGSTKLGFVHIASHFKFNTNDRDSFLLLGDGARLSIEDIKNGLERDREFDFGDVDLLTLSACETAYAVAGADGRQFESFAAIVHQRGVRTVIGTLWPIVDQASARFLHRFYVLSTVGGYSREAALAQAQREFIRTPPTRLDGLIVDYRHPYYWAPYVILQGIRGSSGS